MAGNEPPQHREWPCAVAQGIEIKGLDGLQKGEMLGASPFFYVLRDFMAVRHRRIQWSCCFCRDEMEEKPVKLSLAPMEGITGPVFRKAHASCFGALDSCYLPFIAPAHPGKAFTEKTLKALGKQDGRSVIPQLLTKDADDFVWTAGLLAELGYSEVNLNLGCPSGTVAAKKKGAGILRDTYFMEKFLYEVFEGLSDHMKCRTSARRRRARKIPPGYLRKVASAGLGEDTPGPCRCRRIRETPCCLLPLPSEGAHRPSPGEVRALSGDAASFMLWRDAREGTFPCGVQRRYLLRCRFR